MKPAQERLGVDLEQTDFADLTVPLINNFEAREVHTGAEARCGLFEQVPNPVRWAESVRYLASQGVQRCYEIGAGGVLTGLLRNIEASLEGSKFGDPADFEKLAVARTA
jgi:[acyl-carrier-protein] S-malonyltransferase